nr:hypothetical protein [Tanacetum cinerariifolium]
MERAATIASSLEAEQDGGTINRTQSMETLNEPLPQGTGIGSGPSHIKFALTENPTIYTLLIQQFWQTAIANTLDTREMKITATIDGNVKLIYEVSIRKHLKLEDSDGISTLPNTEIFKQLTLMENASNSDKLTFQKGYFSP